MGSYIIIYIYLYIRSFGLMVMTLILHIKYIGSIPVRIINKVKIKKEIYYIFII